MPTAAAILAIILIVSLFPYLPSPDTRRMLLGFSSIRSVITENIDAVKFSL
jgi:hypothetical protein